MFKLRVFCLLLPSCVFSLSVGTEPPALDSYGIWQLRSDYVSIRPIGFPNDLEEDSQTRIQISALPA
jgi:hypothetical protein